MLTGLLRRLQAAQELFRPRQTQLPGETPATAARRQSLLSQAHAEHILPVLAIPFYGALGFLLLPHVTWPNYLAWVGILIAMDLSRSHLGAAMKQMPALSDLERAHKKLITLDLMTGALYGAGGAFLMPFLPNPNLILFECLLFLLPVTGILVQNISTLGAGLFAALTTAPIVFMWLQTDTRHGVWLVFLEIMYCGFIASGSRLLTQAIARMNLIAQEHDALMDGLEARHIEVQEAMQRAQQAAQMRLRVLNSASHDLRQPMHALSIYSGVLSANNHPDMLRDVVTKVDQVVRSLTELLERLLELSKLISGQTALVSESLDLHVLTEEIAQPFSKTANDRGLAWQLSLEPVRISGDAKAIRKVIGHIFENAAKFTEKGQVLVSLRQEGELAVLRIEDTGIGMSPTDIPHIFEEYFQVHNQARDRRQGVGLGLSIAQRLGQLMNARIEVASVPGSGSTFTVRFPLVMPRHEPERIGSQLAKDELQKLIQSERDGATRIPAKTTEFRDDLCFEVVRTHARSIRQGSISVAAAFAGLAPLYTAYIHWGWYLLWAGISVAFSASDAIYGRHVLKTLDKTSDPHAIHRIQQRFQLLAGISTGVGWAILARYLPQQEYFLSATIFLTFPALSVIRTFSSSRSQMSYGVPITLGIGGHMAWMYSSEYLAVFIFIASLLAITYVSSTYFEQMIAGAVSWRRKREEAARLLSQTNLDIQKATEAADLEGRKRTLALAAASHDLRQPLHALSMCNATLGMNLSEKALLKVIHNVSGIARMMGTLLHRLLDVSRSEPDNLLLVPENLYLPDILGELCEQVRPLFDEKGLQLHLTADRVHVLADTIALRRVINNLLSNALKFTPRGSVSVFASNSDLNGQAMVLIQVRDTGNGIAIADRERVFEEFFQVGDTDSDTVPGFGLGLSIVRRQTRLMGGQVDVVTEPDGGSRFRVWLPAGAGSKNSDAPKHSEFILLAESRKVLLIEDDASIADSMKMLLQAWGMECHIAADGLQADAVVALHGRPELILADLRLPGTEQGAQIANRLRSGKPDCPVLIITGETGGESFEQAISLGFTILQKPVDPRSLHQALRRLLGFTASHTTVQSDDVKAQQKRALSGTPFPEHVPDGQPVEQNGSRLLPDASFQIDRHFKAIRTD